MALSALRALFGEVGSLIRLQDLARRVTFYSEDSFSYLTMEGYVQSLLSDHAQEVVYITSDLEDPLLGADQENLRVLGLRALGPVALSKSKAPVLVMTMPDLGSLHVARPATSTRCVYVFHSLISVHRGYRPDAFDHYDDFFCAGEYHVEELTRRFEMLARPLPRLHRVGYYKLDRIYHQHQSYQKVHRQQPTVLIAPSWHRGNLLEQGGEQLIESLLAQDLRVLLRPHPAFFASVYPQGRALIADVERLFGQHPLFVLDTAMNSEDSFHEADLLITDWSGAAFEYAFGTERPVLFIDTPPKLRNPDWESYGIVPFEVAMRERVGQVLAPDQASEAARRTLELMSQAPQWRQTLIELRQECVFNFGASAAVGSALLRGFLEEAV